MVSSSSEESEPSEAELYWRDMMASLVPKKGKHSAATGSVVGPASGHACVASASGHVEAASASGHVEVASASGASASGHIETAPRRKAQARDWKFAINGGQCFYEAYQGPGGNTYKNWILRCHRHDNCEKTRGVADFSTNNYGELEPLAYLHAWRDMDVPRDKVHRRCIPKFSDVSRQIDTNLQALAELNAQFLS